MNTTTTTPATKKPNRWIEHVKQYRAETGMPWKYCLLYAQSSYYERYYPCSESESPKIETAQDILDREAKHGRYTTVESFQTLEERPEDIQRFVQSKLPDELFGIINEYSEMTVTEKWLLSSLEYRNFMAGL